MSVNDVALVFCSLFVLATVELIRRQKIAERYAILWLALGLSMLVYSSFHYAPPLLIPLGMAFSLAFILHLTIVISKLHRRLIRLTQEMALLKAELGAAGDKEAENVNGSLL